MRQGFRLYRNERQLPPLKRLPSETFFEHCFSGFEGDEAPPSRLPEFYENIWPGPRTSTITTATMRGGRSRRCANANCPSSYQAKMLGDNARRLYNIEPPEEFIRDRVTEIERPDWWPTEAEIKEALKPEAA